MIPQSLWALAAAAIFSIMAAFAKLCSDELTTFELVFYRCLLSVVFLSVFVAAKGLTVRTQYVRLHLLRSVLGVTTVSMWFWALQYMPFSLCMTLTYTTPLFMAANFFVLSLVRRERAPWLMSLAIVVGFAGILCILKPTVRADELWPALICLAVALMDLVVYWQMKKMGNLHEPSWRIVFYFSLLGTVVCAAAVMATTGFHVPHGLTIVGILGMGICATAGQVCSTRSYAYGNMLLSSCLGFSAIPFSLGIGVILFADALDWIKLIGMTLVLCAGVAAVITTKRMQQAKVQKAQVD